MAGVGSGNSVSYSDSATSGPAKSGDISKGATNFNLNAPARALTDSTFGKVIVSLSVFAVFVLGALYLKKK